MSVTVTGSGGNLKAFKKKRRRWEELEGETASEIEKEKKIEGHSPTRNQPSCILSDGDPTGTGSPTSSRHDLNPSRRREMLAHPYLVRRMYR